MNVNQGSGNFQVLQTNSSTICQAATLDGLLKGHGTTFSKLQTNSLLIFLERHSISLSSQVPICRTPCRSSVTDKMKIERQVEDPVAKGFVRPFRLCTLHCDTGQEERWRSYLYMHRLQKIEFNHGFWSSTYSLHWRWVRFFGLIQALQCTIRHHVWLVARHHETKDIPKMVCVTHTNHYKWMVMPFSLHDAPTIFQRVIKSRNGNGRRHVRNLSQLWDSVWPRSQY